MTYDSTPAVQRRRLRVELRRARQESELTQEQAARALDWSLSKLIRIESGRVGISTTDLKAILGLYKITDPETVASLLSTAKASRERSWWSAYRDRLPQTYLQFIQYEEAASTIWSFESIVIPGLLQTKDYVDAIIKKPGILTESAANARIQARVIRQQILERESPPSLVFIFDEAAISRLAGERNIARDQIAHLIRLGERPDVSIRILPFSAGLYKGMQDSFTILKFPDPDDSDVLFIESWTDIIFSRDDAEQISRYQLRFQQLELVSLEPSDSLNYLRSMAAKF